MQSCENGWISSPLAASSDSCYKFVTTQKATWAQAEGLCRDMGGYLAILESIDEIIWMRGFRAYHPQLRERSWVGGYKKEGHWVWKGEVSDSAILHTEWRQGEPNNLAGKEACLELFGTRDIGTESFQWNDLNCAYRLNFICERHQK